ncbi:NADH dehydrogenase [Companilactobacillus mindensis DSM 14500]|uniref:NADH dehydrogenase n=1 Tax=Companilactobacillus mindensis DSM 14500 TaxID=1423770 RepID=A0A0R1QQN4_9LACO|nr:nitroreductase family protein [Companilactobacillus mindensis]KRL44354.1 NADH dehydrogenase [Companilactobacillus mindensis DSM 14500]GEO79760.1 nitroreductase [Companilactobacillus mindensis]
MDETKNLVNNDFKDIMLNRHSYRKFQSDVKIPREEFSEMLEEAITAPSACNLQSWHFVVCDDAEGKAKAHSVMMPFNYPQTDSSSAVIFVFGDTQSHLKYRDVWNKACENGQITAEERDKIFNTFLPLYEHADRNFLEKDATIDGSMVAMQLLLIARAHGYEANPMSGYYFDKVVAAFGLDSKRYIPVTAVAIGKPEGTYTKSVRYNVNDVTDFM